MRVADVRRVEFTDAQWEVLKPLIPKPRRRPDGKGRPAREPREVLEGILWVLRTGAPWKDLPDRFAPYQTCHRWMQKWSKAGVFDRILMALAEDLLQRGQLDLTEGFIDGSFAGTKKRGLGVGPTQRGKGSKIMALTDGHGVPLASHVVSASPHEITLVEDTFDAAWTRHLPGHVIGDKAFDSDALDQRLAEEREVALMAPHRSNQQRACTEDGRCQHWWKVERFFAWPYHFRRLVTCYEFHLGNFQGLVHLGCIIILLRLF